MKHLDGKTIMIVDKTAPVPQGTIAKIEYAQDGGNKAWRLNLDLSPYVKHNQLLGIPPEREHYIIVDEETVDNQIMVAKDDNAVAQWLLHAKQGLYIRNVLVSRKEAFANMVGCLLFWNISLVLPLFLLYKYNKIDLKWLFMGVGFMIAISLNPIIGWFATHTKAFAQSVRNWVENQ